MFTSRRLIVLASAIGLVALVLITLATRPRPDASAEVNPATSPSSAQLAQKENNIKNSDGLTQSEPAKELDNTRPMTFDAKDAMRSASQPQPNIAAKRTFPVYDANGDIIFP